jgi:excisionase family DNA binding protein
VLGKIDYVPAWRGILRCIAMRPAEETPPPEHKTVRNDVQDRPIRALNNSQDEVQDRPQDSLDKITVAEAAERLGVSQDAVRKRIARGTIRHGKGEDGRIFVYLDTFERSSKTVQDEPPERQSKTVQDEDQDKYTRSLEDQIDFLRRELERKDTIIMSLTQRIPELEPSPEQPGAAETASEDAGRGDIPPESQQPSEPRSWWRRFFGFE